MDVERIIADIELLEHIFTLPDDRTPQMSDWKAGSQKDNLRLSIIHGYGCGDERRVSRVSAIFAASLSTYKVSHTLGRRKFHAFVRVCDTFSAELTIYQYGSSGGLRYPFMQATETEGQK
jgi:hypothetical protein